MIGKTRQNFPTKIAFFEKASKNKNELLQPQKIADKECSQMDDTERHQIKYEITSELVHEIINVMKPKKTMNESVRMMYI